MRILAAVLLLAGSAYGHISMNPNSGAETGGYFVTSMKIPHGHQNEDTTRIVMHVPRGILSIVPEKPVGWNVTIVEYDLAEEDRYTSHGRTITTGPEKVIWQAETWDAGLHTDHLMHIDFQVKIGCNFDDPVQSDYSGSQSKWNGQYTLWFKTEQHSSPDNSLEITQTSLWTGAQPDGISGWNPPPSDGVKACPFIFFYPGEKCTIEHSGDQDAGGMHWMGEYVPPEQNIIEVITEQHVIDLATEAAASAQDALADIYIQHNQLDTLEAKVDANTAAIGALTSRVDSLSDDKSALNIGAAALALSATAVGFILALCLFRITAKQQFAQIVSAAPLLSQYDPKFSKDAEMRA